MVRRQEEKKGEQKRGEESQVEEDGRKEQEEKGKEVCVGQWVSVGQEEVRVDEEEVEEEV